MAASSFRAGPACCCSPLAVNLADRIPYGSTLSLFPRSHDESRTGGAAELERCFARLARLFLL
eukprot:83744-Heterocapsa_arctica.AAC.1